MISIFKLIDIYIDRYFINQSRVKFHLISVAQSVIASNCFYFDMIDTPVSKNIVGENDGFMIADVHTRLKRSMGNVF